MFNKLMILFAIFTFALSAETATANKTCKFNLSRPTAVSGTTLPAGEYKVTVSGSKVTIATAFGKNPMDVQAKVETGDKKFDDTLVIYATVSGQNALGEVDMGGSKIKVVFVP